MPEYYSLSDVPASWKDTSTTELIAVPEDKHALSVCVLTGKFTVAIGDFIGDVDVVPEAEKLNGTGVVVPVTATFLAPHFPDGPLTIRPGPVPFWVVDGVICSDEAGVNEGIAVLAGDEYSIPTSVIYNVELDVVDANSDPVEFPIVPFAAIQGTIDYTMLLSQVV